jgi:hypothetical protein
VAEAKALREIGIGTIAMMPNDTATYSEDSFNNMKAFAAIRAAFRGQALRALMGSISKSGAISGGLLEVNKNQSSPLFQRLSEKIPGSYVANFCR